MKTQIEITVNFVGFDNLGNPITQKERDAVNRNYEEAMYIDTYGSLKSNNTSKEKEQ